MREMRVLMTITMMAWSILDEMIITKTLSLVLAISKGLQTVTEMKPANSPDIK
jgi:hypothetical protein